MKKRVIFLVLFGGIGSSLCLEKKLLASKSGYYSGIDRNGNFYRGNLNSGFYYNYGTGKNCYGTGKERKCSNSK